MVFLERQTAREDSKYQVQERPVPHSAGTEPELGGLNPLHIRRLSGRILGLELLPIEIERFSKTGF